MASWTDDILRRLEIRDSIEHLGQKYTTAIKHVLEELQNGPNPAVEGEPPAASNARVEKLIEQLNVAAIGLEKAEVRIGELEAANNALQKQVRGLQGKVAGLNEQIGEKNKLFEVLNDERLAGQIQQNVLVEKNRELAAENASLVKRWMEKVEADAERMNEVNQFLEGGGRKRG